MIQKEKIRSAGYFLMALTAGLLPFAAPQAMKLIALDRIKPSAAEVAANPEHQLRAKFDDAVQLFITRLQHDPDWARKAEEIRHYLQTNPTLGNYVQQLWQDLRAALQRFGSNLYHPSLYCTPSWIRFHLAAQNDPLDKHGQC